MLLSVHADDHEWSRKARSLLDGFGAYDIDSTYEANAKPDREVVHRDDKHRH